LIRRHVDWSLQPARSESETGPGHTARLAGFSVLAMRRRTAWERRQRHGVDRLRADLPGRRTVRVGNRHGIWCPAH